MGREYSDHISGPCTIWYVANTFDLPLTVKYYANDNMAAPDLYLDFSCTPGVYEDSIICSIFCTENSIVPMPYHVTPVWKLDENNNPYYEVSMGEWYRDVLLQHGISYNVEVYIKAVFYGVGDIVLSPDADFSQCMETEDWLLFGRDLPVAADDDESYFIAPYASWEDDSVRYIWQGTDSAMIVFGTSCKFDPRDEMDDTRIDVMEMKAGCDTAKHTNEDIAYYMTYMTNPTNTAKGGVFYVKVLSEGSGTLKVERISAVPPGGDALLLKYGETADVYRNDTSRVYAIPRSWTKAVRFFTPTDHVFKMYLGASADFTTTEAFASYQFDKTTEGHELCLLDVEMSSLWANKLAGENYLYIRFECTDNTTILPMLWTPSDCEAKAKRIKMGQQFEVARNSTAIYRLYHEDIKGGDMTIAWNSIQTACPFYIADTCLISTSNTSHVFYRGSVPKNSSVICTQDTIDSWAQYVDAEGYLYVLFAPIAKAKITVTTSAPEEVDPPCNTVDSVATVLAWDSYTWRGNSYTESGQYIEVTNDTWCPDSIYTLNLTVGTTSYDSFSATTCDSVVYNGKKYTQSGEYKDTLLTSETTRTIVSLNLSITPTPVSEERTEVVWDSLVWEGQTYKQSGDYVLRLTSGNDCEYTKSLHLTIHTTSYESHTLHGCDKVLYEGRTYTEEGIYVDTIPDGENRIIRTVEVVSLNECPKDSFVYFCKGLNHEHTVERDGYILHYKAYTYEEPGEWAMEGVVLSQEANRTLVDLKKAEENIYAHYTDGLTPVKSITWSHRPNGATNYTVITATDTPQWIDAGALGVSIRFICGESFYSDFATDITSPQSGASGQKAIIDGRLVIIRGGVKYSVLGQKIEDEQ